MLDGRGLPAAAAADAGAQPEVEPADPFGADARKSALHSLSGSRCTCPVCLAAKQRRDFAESGSHPHSESYCASQPGCHSWDDVPSYFDILDYGADQVFNGGARYELFGVNPGTASWMVLPLADRNQESVEAGLKLLHAPNENLSRVTIRSDNAPELTGAIEEVSNMSPTTPYRPNSNLAERGVQTYSDLLRVCLLYTSPSPRD